MIVCGVVFGVCSLLGAFPEEVSKQTEVQRCCQCKECPTTGCEDCNCEDCDCNKKQ